jgi:hypothetical protein
MRSLVVAFLAVLPLAACAGPDVAALSVLVTDSTSGAPMANAKVIADTPSHDHPLSIESMLGKTGPIEKNVYTDEAGVAVVEYAAGRAVRIGVLVRGYPLLIQNIDAPWLGESVLLGERDGGRQLRARVTPTARPE